MVLDFNKTLFVRNLSERLSSSQKCDLLYHFGAKTVECMDKSGPLKNTAFATFEDHESCSKALHSLHQLEVLGSRLNVVYSTSKYLNFHPKITEKSSIKNSSVIEESNINLSNGTKINVNLLNTKWNLDYPINPNLHYLYPSPNMTILTNIINAMASVPSFYVQVLHLMNKMNLPSPFGSLSHTPPILEMHSNSDLNQFVKEPCNVDQTEQDMEFSSSEESEISEDSTDGKKLNAPAVPRIKKIIKKRTLFTKPRKYKIDQKKLLKHKKIKLKRSEVFENPEPTPLHKTKKPSKSIAKTVSITNTSDEHVLVKNDQPLTDETGFGKIHPSQDKEDCTNHTEQTITNNPEIEDRHCISSRRLREGRLSTMELKESVLFRNYSKGVANTRLYVKNLSSQVSEKDLRYIFSRFVNLENESEKLMFDIRLMKEGRMRGQAFITLPSISAAEEAIRLTNSYVLNGKPMIVQFARAAKITEN